MGESFLFRNRHSAGCEPLSRVEIGGKPPGEKQKRAFPPDPLLLLRGCVSGCYRLAALVALSCSEFPLSAEATHRKVAARASVQVVTAAVKARGTEMRSLLDCVDEPCTPVYKYYSRSKIPPSSALRAARMYLLVSSGSTLRRAAVAPSSSGQSR